MNERFELIVRAKICPYCNGTPVLQNSIKVYRHRSYGPIWICSNYPHCDSYVGCHRGTTTPLGRLADADLRKAKRTAHSVFDVLWRAKINRDKCTKKKARSAAYAWLADQLGVAREHCHIGMFDVEQCERVVEICKPLLGGRHGTN